LSAWCCGQSGQIVALITRDSVPGDSSAINMAVNGGEDRQDICNELIFDEDYREQVAMPFIHLHRAGLSTAGISEPGGQYEQWILYLWNLFGIVYAGLGARRYERM
jgi:hypothetical protein